MLKSMVDSRVPPVGNNVRLIALSALVAAEKSITSFAPNLPKFVIPTCAIVVAIGTAFDQTTKPGTRWRLSTGYTAKFAGSRPRLGWSTRPTAPPSVSSTKNSRRYTRNGWMTRPSSSDLVGVLSIIRRNIHFHNSTMRPAAGQGYQSPNAANPCRRRDVVK